MDERVRARAAQYNLPVEKMRKEIEENDGLNGLAEEILLGKTLDFLKANVTVGTAEAEGEKASGSKETS